MITLAQQIAIQRWTARIEHSRAEYEIVKLEAEGKCVQCGIRRSDVRARNGRRRRKCYACRKGLGPPKAATS